MDTEYLGQMFSGLAYLVVGLRLFRLALRTGERPEASLGTYFVLTGFDYLLWTGPLVFQLDSYFVACAAVARMAYAIAVVALLVFIREVFRPNENWARGLVWLLSASMLGAIALGYAAGDWVGGDPAKDSYWPYFAGYTGACLWVTLEALRAHAGAKKRHAIGLCEPVVVNRYLLWGGFGAFQVLACMGVVIVDLQATGGDGDVARWADLFLFAGELASIGMLWLAFFPPDFYRNWIAGAAAKRETS